MGSPFAHRDRTPPIPTVGVVALPAILTEHTLVIVVVAVTVETCVPRVGEDVGEVAGLARGSAMMANQREVGEVVVEAHFVPRRLDMTARAVSLGSIVRIVIGMA